MRRITVPLIAAIALFAVACGGGDAEQPELELNIDMQDIAFSQAEVEVPRDTLVRINFTNSGAVLHDFTVDHIPHTHMRTTGSSRQGGHGDHQGADMHLALDADQRGSMMFRASEPGEYEFYCDEPGHREAGMHGTLRVR